MTTPINPPLSNADYHAHAAVSASHLHAVRQSPYAYWRKYVDPNRPPQTPTKAMELGTLVHCAILEPDDLRKRFAICPPRNTKAGKERAEVMAAEGITAVSSVDWTLALALRDSVHAHPVASRLLKSGAAEQSYFWEDLATGLECKCRPDWMDGSTIIDVKTTQDASPAAFAKSVATFRYHVQQAHYLNGTGAERFLFLVVEKQYPHETAVYELDLDASAIGQELAAVDLQRIEECRSLNQWPGIAPEITTLSLPAWAISSND